MLQVRVRQHVNPLARRYQITPKPLEWGKIYSHPSQPLHLDIGCARGKFALEMAHIETHWNFLGLEIREPLVIKANHVREKLGLTNLHYLFCNVNTSIQSLLSSLPPGVLKWVSIQFPDPWFKHRHAKRRILQPELVKGLGECLAPGGVVFLQTDIHFLATEMCRRISVNPCLIRGNSDKWLSENPLPVRTEREIATQNKGKPVYRNLFYKTP